MCFCHAGVGNSIHGPLAHSHKKDKARHILPAVNMAVNSPARRQNSIVCMIHPGPIMPLQLVYFSGVNHAKRLANGRKQGKNGLGTPTILDLDQGCLWNLHQK
jgi:hypothetical protein